MNAEALPAAQLACLLYDAAEGICADIAAVMLIDRHGHFLHDPAFRRIIAAGSSITTGQPLAVIRWTAAIHALEAGRLPCCSSERAVLRIAASLASSFRDGAFFVGEPVGDQLALARLAPAGAVHEQPRVRLSLW